MIDNHTAAKTRFSFAWARYAKTCGLRVSRGPVDFLCDAPAEQAESGQYRRVTQRVHGSVS